MNHRSIRNTIQKSEGYSDVIVLTPGNKIILEQMKKFITLLLPSDISSPYLSQQCLRKSHEENYAHLAGTGMYPLHFRPFGGKQVTNLWTVKPPINGPFISEVLLKLRHTMAGVIA